jgi:2-keto-4-pentenoate hydratase/2-oxohepta-3-ene-1,7-dioic acid hydratase in catechol pathway
MKVLTYSWQGKTSFGVATDDGVIDGQAQLGGKFADLKAVIEAGALDELRAACDGKPVDAPLSEITYLPVIGNPDKILMVGLNYKAHREEAGRDPAAHPSIFVRFPDSQVGHNQPMIRPKASERFDYEGELAVIIGKGGRHITQADALSHVCGYSCYNDGSIRDYQRHTTQWTPGKNFVGTGAFGPWMVTADEIPDPQALSLTTRLNGNQMQDTTLDLMLFPVVELIEYCSTFCNLVPGDVIVSGTPGGVGYARKPPVFMKPGDTIEIDISGVGILKNGIVDE